MLGLRRHTQAFSGYCEQGRLFSAVIGLPKAVASLVAREGSRVSAHGLQQLQRYGSGVAAHGLSRCGVWGVLDQGLYLPSPSSAPAGRFLPTAPPGKSQGSLTVPMGVYTLLASYCFGWFVLKLNSFRLLV